MESPRFMESPRESDEKNTINTAILSYMVLKHLMFVEGSRKSSKNQIST